MTSLRDIVGYRSHPVPYHRGYSIGGVILLALAIIGIYSALPEIRRYLQIERM